MQPVYGCAKTLWPHLKARNRVVYGPMEIAKHYPGALPIVVLRVQPSVFSVT
jgi:hypothetical protein